LRSSGARLEIRNAMGMGSGGGDEEEERRVRKES
jgi:hypothetical protein